MKKKKVVALLLAAAMTTASFMPSTGFFNVTEVQASEEDEDLDNGAVIRTASGVHYVSNASVQITTGSGTTTASAATMTTPDMTNTGWVNVTTGGTVTMSAIVSAAAVESADALARTLGAYKIGIISDGGITETVGNLRTGSAVTSTHALNVAFPTQTTAAAITGSVTFRKFGDYKLFFTSSGAYNVSFGAVNVRVQVPLDNKISVSSASIKTESAANSAQTVSVNTGSLKLKYDTTEIDKKYISGSGLDYYYKWYKYKKDASATSNGAVWNLSSDWELVTGPSIDSKYTVTETGLYGVEVYYGTESASSSAFRVAKYVEVGNDKGNEVGVKASDITKVQNQKNKYTVSGYYVKNGAVVSTPSDSSMQILWYALDEGTAVDETSGAALKELATITGSGVKRLPNYEPNSPDGLGWKHTVTLPETLTESSILVAVVSATNVTSPESVTVRYKELVKYEPEGDSVEYTTGAPYKISASGLRYNKSDKNANQIVVLNPGFYGEDGKPVNPSKYNITANAAFDVYTTNYSDYIKVQSYGAVSGSSLIDNIGKTFVKTVSGASIFDDNGNAIIKVESGWSNAYIVIVIRDRAENSKVIPYAAAQENVSYVKAATDTDSRRTTSNTGRGTTGTNGTTGGSTGTNGTTGGSSTGTSTTGTGTGTTTPTGTTPTTNVVENADGSKTTTATETKADGSTVETSKTEFKDGSTLEVTTEKKADGTVIETTVETAANGDKATTVYTTSPNGTKSKKVSIVKADGSSETTTITENADGSATIVNETKDASGSTSVAYSLAAGAAGVTVDKIDTTAKKVVIPAKIAIAGGAATLKGVTALKANTLSLEGKTIKVTKVGAAALKGNKTATNLVIGKNIKTIGKQAFMNATKVKTVNFKGNVNTIGKNSFKNINKKATIKIKATAKQFKALKKKIKNKGAAPAKVTYKRVK